VKVALKLEHLLKRKPINRESAIVLFVVLSHLAEKVERCILELCRNDFILAAAGEWVDSGWFFRKLWFGGFSRNNMEMWSYHVESSGIEFVSARSQ